MRSTHASDIKFEPPQVFGAEFQTADPAHGSTGHHVNFEIGTSSKGPVWVIQDSCECRSLFEYHMPAASDEPGTPCIQLAPEFSSVGGNPTLPNCNPNYYFSTSTTGPITIAGAVMSNYVPQNSPCAASEVVIEGSFFDLLLGYIDRNAAEGSNVGGDFYEGLISGDRVQVQLVIKNESNWQGHVPAECASSIPYPLVYKYATPPPAATADFEIDARVPNTGTNCTAGDFHWETLTPTTSGSNSIYTIYFEGSEIFYKKIRGLRIRALDDANALEGPEIVHIQILSANYLPSAEAPAIPVEVGWSSAFRVVIMDRP
jgi:hypothetical protein